MKIEPEKSLALLDSNLLIYAYAEDSSKRQRAAIILNDCFLGKATFAISLQNIGEFCNIALGKYGLAIKDVWERVEELIGCGNFIKVNYNASTFQYALKISANNSIDFWDAMIIATMKENDIDIIYTEDAGFGKIEGIKAVNPFLEK